LDGIIAMIAWGITYALTRRITTAVGPIIALLLFRLVAVLALFSWTAVTKTKFSFPTKIIFIATAGPLDFLGFLAFNFGITTQLVSIASPIAATAPAVTITLAYFFLKERLLNNQKLGIMAILAGLVLISLI
jgi:drug/metabolite transporter (DMT)-like permease